MEPVVLMEDLSLVMEATAAVIAELGGRRTVFLTLEQPPPLVSSHSLGGTQPGTCLSCQPAPDESPGMK